MSSDSHLWPTSVQLARLLDGARHDRRSGARKGSPVRSVSVHAAERRLSAAEITEIIDAYTHGTSAAELAKTWPLAKSTILELLHRHSVKLRNQGLADEDVATAVKLYTDGMSLKRVGERFGCDAETVRKRLVAHGVQIRARRGWS